jgi:hypothetical protein
MSDDIVKKQLLRTDGYDLLREEPIYVNPDGPKAAAEIERLTAERDAARAELAAAIQRAERAEASARSWEQQALNLNTKGGE